MVKIQNPLLLSLYSQIVDQTLSETSSIEEANVKLRELGREMGPQLYLNTEIPDKTKDVVTTREDVAKLIEIIFKVLFNKRPNDIDMQTTRGSILISDNDCIFCQEVHLEGMHGFGYCEIFSGVLEAILEIKGVEAKVFQELSRATGADTCTWHIRIV